MPTFLKSLVWICIFITLAEAPQPIVRNYFLGTIFVAMGVYVLLVLICFWGTKRLNK